MQTKKSVHATTFLLTVFAALLLIGSRIEAQTNTEAQSATPKGSTAATSSAEEIVHMTPFEVSTTRDVGYYSTNSASITRLAAPVMELPMTVQILNQEVMNDLGVSTVTDLARFVVGGNDKGGSTATVSQFDLRGFNASDVDDTLRDGFRLKARTNIYNLDRLEIILAPNSVVTGAADPGGQVNYITKSALMRQNFSAVNMKVGSFGFYHGAFDTNVSQHSNNNDFGLRVNAFYEHSPIFMKFSDHDHAYGIALAAKVDLSKRTTVAVKFEHSYERRAPWTGTPDRWSGSPGLFGGYSIKFHQQVPKLYNYDEANATEGPDSFQKTKNDYLYGEFTHSFADNLNFQLLGGTQRELMPQLMSSTAAPSVSYDATTGSYYTNRAWSYQEDYDRRNNLRALLNYDLHLSWMEQKFIFGYSYLDVKLRDWTDSLNDSAGGVVDRSPLYPGGINAANYGLNMTNRFWVAQAPTGDNLISSSYYVNATGSYLNGRIKTVFGYASYDATRTDYHYQKPVSGSFYQGTASKPAPTSSTAFVQKAQVPMVSVVFAITPEINVYADYSKSFRPQASLYQTIDLNTGAIGGIAVPQTGMGYEGGIKFDFSKTGLSGSICAYQVVMGNIQQIVDTEIVKRLLGEALSLQQRFYVCGVEQTSKGVELQLFYNPSRAVSIMANWSYNASYDSKSLQDPTLLGQEANVHFKQLANIVAKYTYIEGPMKGWFIGCDSFIRGRQWRIQGAEYGTNAGYAIVGALVGYSRKWGSNSYTIQLKVDNIANKIYARTYAVIGEPRTFSVSASLQF